MIEQVAKVNVCIAKARVRAILWLLQALGMPRDGAERRLRLQGELEKRRQVLSGTIALLDEMTPKEKRVSHPSPADGYVYFILNKKRNAVKIGYSANPAKRLAELQTSNSDKLVLLGAIVGDVSLERALHAAFDSNKLSGEWFTYDGDVKTYISRVNGSHMTAMSRHTYRGRSHDQASGSAGRRTATPLPYRRC